MESEKGGNNEKAEMRGEVEMKVLLPAASIQHSCTPKPGLGSSFLFQGVPLSSATSKVGTQRGAAYGSKGDRRRTRRKGDNSTEGLPPPAAAETMPPDHGRPSATKDRGGSAAQRWCRTKRAEEWRPTDLQVNRRTMPLRPTSVRRGAGREPKQQTSL